MIFKSNGFFFEFICCEFAIHQLDFWWIGLFPKMQVPGSPGVAVCCEGLKVRVKSQEKVEGVREPGLGLPGPVRRVGPRAVGHGAWGPTGPLGLE